MNLTAKSALTDRPFAHGLKDGDQIYVVTASPDNNGLTDKRVTVTELESRLFGTGAAASIDVGDRVHVTIDDPDRTRQDANFGTIARFILGNRDDNVVFDVDDAMVLEKEPVSVGALGTRFETSIGKMKDFILGKDLISNTGITSDTDFSITFSTVNPNVRSRMNITNFKKYVSSNINKFKTLEVGSVAGTGGDFTLSPKFTVDDNGNIITSGRSTVTGEGKFGSLTIGNNFLIIDSFGELTSVSKANFRNGINVITSGGVIKASIGASGEISAAGDKFVVAATGITTINAGLSAQTLSIAGGKFSVDANGYVIAASGAFEINATGASIIGTLSAGAISVAGGKCAISADGSITTLGNINVGFGIKVSINATNGSIAILGGLSAAGNKFTINEAGGLSASSTIYTSLDLRAAGGIFAVSADGSIYVNTSKFIVAAATGNTTIAGTLSAGANKFTVSADGSIGVNTNKFIVASASGNTTIYGTLSVAVGEFTVSADGSIGVNTDKFTVSAATGNTIIAGTLNVGPYFVVDLNGTVTINTNCNVSSSGKITAKELFFANGAFSVSPTGGTIVKSWLNVANSLFEVDNGGNLNINSNKFIVIATTGNTTIYGNLSVANGKFVVNDDGYITIFPKPTAYTSYGTRNLQNTALSIVKFISETGYPGGGSLNVNETINFTVNDMEKLFDFVRDTGFIATPYDNLDNESGYTHFNRLKSWNLRVGNFSSDLDFDIDLSGDGAKINRLAVGYIPGTGNLALLDGTAPFNVDTNGCITFNDNEGSVTSTTPVFNINKNNLNTPWNSAFASGNSNMSDVLFKIKYNKIVSDPSGGSYNDKFYINITVGHFVYLYNKYAADFPNASSIAFSEITPKPNGGVNQW